MSPAERITSSSSSRSQARPVRKPEPARPGRWKRILLGTLAVLALLAWFAPTIIARSPALSWGLAKATAGLDGEAKLQGASLGWLSPVVLEGLTVTDHEGRPML